MKKYTKIILILVLAFLITDIANKTFFLANTPIIDKYKLAMIPQTLRDKIMRIPIYITNLPSLLRKGGLTEIQNQLSQGKSPLSQDNTQTNESKVMPINQDPYVNEILSKVILKEITKGVYAGEYNGVAVYQYAHNLIEWVPYTYKLRDGRTITINVPKGQQPPTQDEVQIVYGQ